VDYTYLDFANSENNPSYGEKTINEYNGQNCLLNSLTLNYDNQTYSWDSLSKITCTFNTEGKKLSELTSEYNYVHLQWNNTGYTENTYSEELLETSIVYNYQNGDLINYEKFEYAYDEYGRIITYSDYQWKPILSLWFNNYQENYFYENNGYSVDYLSFEMNNDGISIPSQKVTYFFDLNDLLISSTGFSWNPSSSEWDNQSRLHFDYDDSLRMTYMLREYWDLSCLCWIDEAIDEYTYDVNGNIIYYGQKAWNPERNSWDLYYEEKDYNDDVLFNDMVLPLYAVNLEEFGNMLLTAKYYATDAPCVRYNRYYYTKFEVNLTPIENKNTEAYLFPNPASSTVSVRLPEGLLSADFYLFDIQGRCIIEKSIQTESQISISELSNGLYFYKVIVGVDTFSGKLIKE
jgi:hypothetical protein